MFEKVPFFSMSIPALNDAISQKHYEKMRAIENLDFEKARLLDADKQQIEFGIDPDVKVDMTEEDKARGLDTLIEAARRLLQVKPE